MHKFDTNSELARLSKDAHIRRQNKINEIEEQN